MAYVFDFWKEPAAVFAPLANAPFALFLDSAMVEHPDARWSYILFDPVETLSVQKAGNTIFDRLKSLLNKYRQTVTDEHAPPFTGGLAGYFSYDLGRALEKLPKNTEDDMHWPDVIVGVYTNVLAFDHTKQKIIYCGDEEGLKKAENMLHHANSQMASRLRGNDNVEWNSRFTKDGYETAIQKVIDYIHAGDIFQANISQRFIADIPESFDPYAHYCHLRTINPAPFSAYFNAGDGIISSASPERFLSCDSKGYVQTKPIKGTRPNSDGADEELLASAKDRAENAMIVDILRNDLAKVCKADSITVDQFAALETFAGVHHLVSTIHGQLTEDKSALDLLKACFPGGSITGAPKIRAQEIIEELEPTRRGPYCGSIATIGFDGAMDSSILIRTLLYKNNAVSFQVGGGITANSNPEDEYQETLTKAAKIFESFT